MERRLDAVSPEVRAWLRQQKPKTAEELGYLANLNVQSLGKGHSLGEGMCELVMKRNLGK